MEVTVQDAAQAAGPLGVLIASLAAVAIAWIRRPAKRATPCASAADVEKSVGALGARIGEQLARIEKEVAVVRALRGGGR